MYVLRTWYIDAAVMQIVVYATCENKCPELRVRVSIFFSTFPIPCTSTRRLAFFFLRRGFIINGTFRRLFRVSCDNVEAR